MLVTRGLEQADELMSLLRRAGADVVDLPTIEVLPAADPAALDGALARLDQYDWVVFTSANGVRHALRAAEQIVSHRGTLGGFPHPLEEGQEEGVPTAARGTSSALTDVAGEAGGRATWPRIASVGRVTSSALAGAGLRIAFEPSESRGEALARELPIAPNERVLLLRSDLADARLPATLRERGASVDAVVAYRTTPLTRPAPEIAAQIAAGQIDAVLLASPSSARGLVAACGDQPTRAKLPAIVIGPTTAAAARGLGLTVAGQAVEPSARGLVAGLIQAMEERSGDRDRA